MDGGVKFNGQEKNSQIAQGIIHIYYFNNLAFFTKIKTVLMSLEI